MPAERARFNLTMTKRDYALDSEGSTHLINLNRVGGVLSLQMPYALSGWICERRLKKNVIPLTYNVMYKNLIA